MNRGRAVLIAAALLVATAVVVVPSVASSASPSPCTDDSRACVIAASTTYLDALKSHDASKVRFAPNVVRYENGIVSGRGAASMRKNLETYPLFKIITGIRNVQWVEENGNAVAFYLIDTGLIPGQAVPHTATANIAEMFKVKHGLIEEIDVVACFGGGFHPESGHAESLAGTLTDLCIRSGPRGI